MNWTAFSPLAQHKDGEEANLVQLSPAAAEFLRQLALGLAQQNLHNSHHNSHNATEHEEPARHLTIQEDHKGAMLFTVAVVVVYGLSIVAFIAGHLRKRQVNKDEESQITRYLKRGHLEEQSKLDQQFHVTRLKSRLLASSAWGQRHGRRAALKHAQRPRASRGLTRRQTGVPCFPPVRGGSQEAEDSDEVFWANGEASTSLRATALPLASYKVTGPPSAPTAKPKRDTKRPCVTFVDEKFSTTAEASSSSLPPLPQQSTLPSTSSSMIGSESSYSVSTASTD